MATRRIGILYYDIATARRWRRGGSASIITITFTTLPALVEGDEIGITTLPALVDGNEEDRHLLRHCQHSSTATRMVTRRISTYYDIATTRRWRRGGLSFTTTTCPLVALLLKHYDTSSSLTCALLNKAVHPRHGRPRQERRGYVMC